MAEREGGAAGAGGPGEHVRGAARYAGLLAREARLLALRVASGSATGVSPREPEVDPGPVFDHGLVANLQEVEAALGSLEAGLRGPRWSTACTPTAEAGERERHLEAERSWRRERNSIRAEVTRLSGLYESEVIALKRALEIAKTEQQLAEQDREALQVKLAGVEAAAERAAREAAQRGERAEAEAKSKRALAEALREALQRESAAQAEIEQLRLTQKYLKSRSPSSSSPLCGPGEIPQEKLDLMKAIDALQRENAGLRVTLGLKEARSSQPSSPARAPVLNPPSEPISAC